MLCRFGRYWRISPLVSIKDPFGLSWQIVPRRFMELIADKNPKKVRAVMEAMMTMVKLDVAALESAYAAA